jgi:two-component system, chemotaxis family, chemotaxis protein CheY
LKLLIVDDNLRMRSIVRNILEDVFDTVHEIDDGEQALEIYKNVLPDWVIMDIKMNTIDGITATQNIKAIYPNARIIILTNFPDRELKDAAIKAGANDYVLKDNLMELRTIIASAAI